MKRLNIATGLANVCILLHAKHKQMTTFKLPGFKSFALLLLLLPIAFSGCSDADPVEFYVSVDGDDSADGSISNPYATIPVALEKVRTFAI